MRNADLGDDEEHTTLVKLPLEKFSECFGLF